MDIFFDEIINNEKKFSDLASRQFSDKIGVTRENVKEILSKRSIEIRTLINDTNELITKYVTPYVNDYTLLDIKKAKQLQTLAEKLSSYKDNIDNGLAYQIRHTLTEFAKSINDDDMYIENMFYKGLTLFYLDSTLFKQEMSQCYENILALSNRYAQFDKPTRNIIVRAFGNYYISVPKNDLDESFKRFNLAIDFWNNTAKKIDNDFPWNAYHRNVSENTCSGVISALRAKGKENIKEEYIIRLNEAAEKLNEELKKGIDYTNHDFTSDQVKNLYYLYAARYYNGKITIAELVEFLFRVYEQAENEYTYDDLYKKLHVTALFFHYLTLIPEVNYSKEERDLITHKIEEDVFEYAMHIPNTISRRHVTSLISNFAIGANLAFEDFEYFKLLLSLTVFRHTPTYVHSVIVGKITFLIIEYLAKYHPEEFIGMPNINNTQDLKDNLGEILLFSWYGSLIHDIGKIVYSHVVSFYVRKLSDKEFEMIKHHTDKAKGFIRSSQDFSKNFEVFEILNEILDFKFNDNSKLFEYFADIALGHHKSYNGKFGYPTDFDNLSSPVKLIIDIVSIADSIDAATDSVGRSYAHEKTLEDMREDLLSQIGDRYSPVVVKLIFENQDLYNAIDEIISKDRYDVYFSCFSTHDLSDTMTPPNITLEQDE